MLMWLIGENSNLSVKYTFTCNLNYVAVYNETECHSTYNVKEFLQKLNRSEHFDKQIAENLFSILSFSIFPQNNIINGKIGERGTFFPG